MTSTTISYLQAISGAASLIVPTLQIMHNKERGKYLKRITPIGWVIIVLAAYMITTALLSINVTNKEKKADENDLVEKMSDKFSKALEKYGKTYDPKTNTIHDTQSVFVAIKPAPIKDVNETPELTIDGTQVSPNTQIQKEDTSVAIFITSLRNTAYVKSYRFLIFKIENNFILKQTPDIVVGHYSEDLKIIPINTTYSLILFVNRIKNGVRNFVFVVEVIYQNNKNKVQPIFRKMYKVLTLPTGIKATNVDDENYKDVSKWIKEYKY